MTARRVRRLAVVVVVLLVIGAIAVVLTTRPKLDDRRFHNLLPDEEWGRLPLAIWRRCSKRFADGETVVYVGMVE